MPKPPRTRAASPASSLIERAPFGMFRISADGAVLEANPAFARMLGYERPADLVALHVGRDLLSDPAELPRMLAAFDAGTAAPEHVTWRRRDRSLLLVWTTGHRVPLSRGAVAYDCWTEDLSAHEDAEARFRALVEHTFDLVALFAPDGRVLWSSPGAVPVLGHDPEDTVGGNLAQFLHPDDRDAAMRLFAALAAQPGRTERVTFRGRHTDGSYHHLEAVAVNRLDHPAIHAIVVTFWDVTERVRMEEMLRESEAYYRAVLEQAGDAIFVLAAGGDVITANRRACEMFGYSPEEILGVRLRQTYVPEERDQIQSRLERLAGGETLQYERQALRKDGTVFPVEITARMLEDGKIQSILRDISDRRRIEEQIRQSSKMEAVGQLAGGVAHDFNNLLTAILGGCGFLLDDPQLAAEHRRDVEEIQNAARRAAALTQQLLAFSRKQLLQPELLPLNAVVTGVAPLLRRLIGEDVTITTALAENLPDVRADRSQLEQVVINLCVNARDAMPKGGTLSITTEEADLDAAYVAAHH
ncbi:MAG: PAS domain S-box protein, partial [Gemmatimonadales bacterium]